MVFHGVECNRSFFPGLKLVTVSKVAVLRAMPLDPPP